MTYNFRAQRQARQAQREATERRMRRMFLIGLIVPAVACAVAALVIGPDSWLGWAAVIATPFAVSAGVAIVFMLQDRRSDQ